MLSAYWSYQPFFMQRLFLLLLFFFLTIEEDSNNCHKIPDINPGLIFVQTTCSSAYFQWGFSFAEEFCISILLGLDKGDLKKQNETLWWQPQTASSNSPWVCILECLLLLFLSEAYFQRDLYLEFYGISKQTKALGSEFVWGIGMEKNACTSCKL